MPNLLTPASTVVNDVSVIVPTFNRAPMLQECIASLLAQSRPPLEVLVVDDGSTDATAEVLRRMPAPVKCLHKANGGKPSALNFALPHVRGRWVWFFDDDDVALPESIEVRLRALDGNPDAQLIVSRFLWGSSDEQGRIVAGEPLQWPPFTSETFYLKFLQSCFAHMNGMLIRRDRIDEVGSFRTDLLTSEDYDFSIRVARGARVAICDAPTFVFRQHEGMRGPAAHRYDAADRVRKFAAGDAAVGRSIRLTHSLPEYIGKTPGADLSPETHLAALFARLEVMAGKGLLAELASDAVDYCAAMDQAGTGIDPAIVTRLKSALQMRYLTLAMAAAPGAALKGLKPLCATAAGRIMLRHIARAIAGAASWQDLRPLERLRLFRLAASLASAAAVPNATKGT